MTPSDLFLLRLGRVELPEWTAPTPALIADSLLEALDLELAALGYALRYDLRQRLAQLPQEVYVKKVRSVLTTLAASLGADVKHKPLFKRFPEDVPRNTHRLWIQKFLGFYFQIAGLPCLTCGQLSSTHVLKPCQHVVCDRCFDGSNYTACPVCEKHVDRSSPFFREASFDLSTPAVDRVTFKLLTPCSDPLEEARQLFVTLCQRKQAMSPQDVEALTVLIGAHPESVPEWLPEIIPVRENVAIVFGTLLKARPQPDRLLASRPYLKSATDLLRLLAVYSDQPPSLIRSIRAVPLRPEDARRWHGTKARLIAHLKPARHAPSTPIRSALFKVARLSRPLRKAILGILEDLPPQSMREDLWRQRVLWKWVGRFLHPLEQRRRYPRCAEAFAALMGTRVQGSPRPNLLPTLRPGLWQDSRGRLRIRRFSSLTEALIREVDIPALVNHLSARPGELARRLDFLLRSADAPEEVLIALRPHLPALPTPLLLTLSASLSKRTAPFPIRVFFPKDAVFKAPSAEDSRALLPEPLIALAIWDIELELLERLSRKPPVSAAVLDRTLLDLVVPFNERTLSKGLVSMPRGSSLAVPVGKHVRLFLHWCQPDEKNTTTDIDLSVGFFDASWQQKGTCAYYELTTFVNYEQIAVSSGDLRDAPYPHGASEFVDIDYEAALNAGVRYAVMAVTNFSGLSFSKLERGYAGLMVRDRPEGPHFDPRAVTLKFDMSGENGVFVPLVYDLVENRLFWLDAWQKGALMFNNLDASVLRIQRICSTTMQYFQHRVRPSIFYLAALHAAARAPVVFVRDGHVARLERAPEEGARDFLRRILQGEHAEQGEQGVESEEPLRLTGKVFAALLHGDLELPEGSEAYALFRERLEAPLSASDLLS